MEETNKFKGCKAGFTITEELKQKDKIKTRLLKFIIFKKRTESEVFNKFKDEYDNGILSEVIQQLKELKLQPDTKAPDDEIVKEQVPPSGTKLMENGIVKLYTNEYNTRVSKEVPNLKGKTLQQAKSELESRNLNISAEGTGIIISQEITSGKQVDEGTVIRVKLQEKISNSQH